MTTQAPSAYFDDPIPSAEAVATSLRNLDLTIRDAVKGGTLIDIVKENDKKIRNLFAIQDKATARNDDEARRVVAEFDKDLFLFDVLYEVGTADGKRVTPSMLDDLLKNLGDREEKERALEQNERGRLRRPANQMQPPLDDGTVPPVPLQSSRPPRPKVKEPVAEPPASKPPAAPRKRKIKPSAKAAPPPPAPIAPPTAQADLVSPPALPATGARAPALPAAPVVPVLPAAPVVNAPSQKRAAGVFNLPEAPVPQPPRPAPEPAPNVPAATDVPKPAPGQAKPPLRTITPGAPFRPHGLPPRGQPGGLHWIACDHCRARGIVCLEQNTYGHREACETCSGKKGACLIFGWKASSKEMLAEKDAWLARRLNNEESDREPDDPPFEPHPNYVPSPPKKSAPAGPATPVDEEMEVDAPAPGRKRPAAKRKSKARATPAASKKRSKTEPSDADESSTEDSDAVVDGKGKGKRPRDVNAAIRSLSTTTKDLSARVVELENMVDEPALAKLRADIEKAQINYNAIHTFDAECANRYAHISTEQEDGKKEREDLFEELGAARAEYRKILQDNKELQEANNVLQKTLEKVIATLRETRQHVGLPPDVEGSLESTKAGDPALPPTLSSAPGTVRPHKPSSRLSTPTTSRPPAPKPIPTRAAGAVGPEADGVANVAPPASSTPALAASANDGRTQVEKPAIADAPATTPPEASATRPSPTPNFAPVDASPVVSSAPTDTPVSAHPSDDHSAVTSAPLAAPLCPAPTEGLSVPPPPSVGVIPPTPVKGQEPRRDTPGVSGGPPAKDENSDIEMDGNEIQETDEGAIEEKDSAVAHDARPPDASVHPRSSRHVTPEVAPGLAVPVTHVRESRSPQLLLVPSPIAPENFLPPLPGRHSLPPVPSPSPPPGPVPRRSPRHNEKPNEQPAPPPGPSAKRKVTAGDGGTRSTKRARTPANSASGSGQ